MLRQIEWRQQNGPITKSGILPVTTFFGKFVSVLEPLKKSYFDVPTTQMYIFVFYESTKFNFRVLFPCEYP